MYVFVLLTAVVIHHATLWYLSSVTVALGFLFFEFQIFPCLKIDDILGIDEGVEHHMKSTWISGDLFSWL
jgi:hypothetical protein